jgi:hypothetical protein
LIVSNGYFMKAKKRRSTICSNCESPLEESFNFCPVCGQSNTTSNITFGILISEFVDNYLGLESKMAHSVAPFLLSPGKLTNRFQDGKIKHFIHPVRLYLVLSVFYFFVVSYLLSFDLSELSDNNDFNIPADVTLSELRYNAEMDILSDTIKYNMLSDSLKNQYAGITNFNTLYDSLLTTYDKDELGKLKAEFNLMDLTKGSDEGVLTRAGRLARDKRISNDAFLDSLNSGKNGGISFWNDTMGDHTKEQIREIFKDNNGFKSFVLGNLPLMMFLLIPLFGAVLKLVYIRRKHLYIKHIVHALHVHSFAYFIYGAGLLIMFKLITETNLPNWDITVTRSLVGGALFFGVSTYVYISFLNVYKQHWFKTLVKFNIVGFVYVNFLFVFFGTEIFISFWYY